MAGLDEILYSAQGGQLVANLAQRFGLSEEQMESAIKALTPALAIGLSNAAEEPAAFGKVVGALSATERYSFFDEPEASQSDDSVAMGRDLLTDLFGSPDAAGQVVQVAARESGVRPDILSQLLPVLASILISGLGKAISNQGLGGVLGQLVNSGALNDILGQVLGGGQTPRQGGEAGRAPGGGLDDILGQVLGGGRAPQPGPSPTPPGGGMARAPGGLGDLLGGLLGGLLRGRRPPPGMDRGPADAGGGFNRGGPLDVDAGMGRPGPSGLPEGIDEASLQQAIEQIQKTLKVGKSAPANTGGQSDLESLLGQLLGKR